MRYLTILTKKFALTHKRTFKCVFLIKLFIVRCQGVVQLGVPAPRFVRGGLVRVGFCMSTLFYFNLGLK